MANKWTKEKRREYQREWRKKNSPEQIKKTQKTQKAYRENNKDKVKQMWDEWYEKNPERSPKRRFTESKNKATKKRSLTWTLTLEEYITLISMPCYYCNYKLGEPVKRSCGLDRLDSNIGYEIYNVVSCCYVCNTIKNEHLTSEETKIAVKAILDFRSSNKK